MWNAVRLTKTLRAMRAPYFAYIKLPSVEVFMSKLTVCFSLLLFLPSETHAQVTYFGPVPYLQLSDTPAGFSALPIKLENFEDGVLDSELASASIAIVAPSPQTDSVDIDDGVLDGSGLGGHSAFSGVPVEVTFSTRPLSAGVVWTDGGFLTNVSFEAFDASGVSLGVHGPFSVGDTNNSGGTNEDRFFGAHHPGGISKIRISHTSGGYEIDHVQWTKNLIFGDGFE
jgi:hypothetical protein